MKRLDWWTNSPIQQVYTDLEDQSVKDTDVDNFCSYCGGCGYIEYGPSCSRIMSECCGGCFEEVTCEVCDGTGLPSSDS